MGKEFELKFAVPSAEVLDAVEQALDGQAVVWNMATTYYDTPDRAMRSRKWTLRVRQENETSVVTVKTPAPGGARGEWEYHGTDPVAAAPLKRWNAFERGWVSDSGTVCCRRPDQRSRTGLIINNKK